MKTLLVYNPKAGQIRKLFAQIDYLIECFQKQNREILFYRLATLADGTSNLSQFAEKIKENPGVYDRILIAGGDGTVHHVVNTMLKSDIDLPFGIFPVGTCNDYAIQFSDGVTLKSLVNAFTGDHMVCSDVGKANDRYFINVASLGSLVDVSAKTNQAMKNTIGPAAYYLKGLEQFAKMETYHVQVEAMLYQKDGQLLQKNQFDGEIFFMLVQNGPSAGGFNKIGTHCVYDDGLLDVMIVKKCLSVDVINLFVDILNNRHLENKHVVSFRTNRMQINCAQDVVSNLDGEASDPLPLTIGVLPRKLRILIP